MNKCLLAILLFFLCAFHSYGQSGDIISGKVLCANKKEPLPFTNVVFLGKSEGTVTNEEGKYLINVSKCSANDTIVFSFLGYISVKKSVENLRGNSTIYLKENIIELGAVTVISTNISVKDIIQKVKENYENNYPELNSKRKIYFHTDTKTVFKKAKFDLLKSSMSVVSKDLFKRINNSFPDTLHVYSDILSHLYEYDTDVKLMPIKAVGLSDKWDISGGKQIEDAFNEYSDDPDVFWKIRSGLIGTRLDRDSVLDEVKADSIYVKVKTETASERLMSFIENNTVPYVAKWDFIKNPSKYKFKVEGGAMQNDEYAYKILFTPKGRGLFQGEIYVSTESFAVLRLNYSLAPDKKGRSFSLFGISYKEKGLSTTIIYDKNDKGYFLKYISKKTINEFGVNRNIVLKQKRKRTFFNKTLKEVKASLDLSLETTDVTEYLLVSQEETNSSEFENIEEKPYVKYRRVKSYEAGNWNDYSVVAPTEEIKKYKKQLED